MQACAIRKYYVVVFPHNIAREKISRAHEISHLQLDISINRASPGLKPLRGPDTLNTNGKSIIQFNQAWGLASLHVDTRPSGPLYHKSIFAEQL